MAVKDAIPFCVLGGERDTPVQSDSIPSSPISFIDEKNGLPLSSSTTFQSTFSPRSSYQIYHKQELHRTITPVVDPSRERFWGPTKTQSKENRKKRKLEKTTPPDDRVSFFLNTPYLAFHLPPSVLYQGTNRYNGTPLVFIHNFAFWRKWKIQLGPSIATPGVIDPRGVVCWRHNGGDKAELKADDRKLKGYKVRTWRLWGEHGKDYVKRVKAMRKEGLGPDPDIVEQQEKSDPVRADEVVYLRWVDPFSRHTRKYHFQYAGIDLYWKGTGSVTETRACGIFLKWNHLKLVAMIPTAIKNCETDRAPDKVEVCLGKYTSSVAVKKSGTLELFDASIWRLVCEHMPTVLEQMQSILALDDSEHYYDEKDEECRMAALKKTYLYQVIVATAMCMIQGEREKREVVKAILLEAITGGAGATG